MRNKCTDIAALIRSKSTNNREISVCVDSLVLASCLSLLHINLTTAVHTNFCVWRTDVVQNFLTAWPQECFQHVRLFSLRSTCEISSLQHRHMTAVRWSHRNLEPSTCTSKPAFVFLMSPSATWTPLDTLALIPKTATNRPTVVRLLCDGLANWKFCDEPCGARHPWVRHTKSCD